MPGGKTNQRLKYSLTVSLGLGLSTGWFGKRWSACHSCHMSVSPRGPRPSVTCHRVMRAAAQCDGGLQWWRRYGRLHTGGERRWDCGAPLLCCRRARLTHGLRIRGGPWRAGGVAGQRRDPEKSWGGNAGLGTREQTGGKKQGRYWEAPRPGEEPPLDILHEIVKMIGNGNDGKFVFFPVI